MRNFQNRSLVTSAILVMAACLNVGEPQIQAASDQYAYEIPTPAAQADSPRVPPVAGDESAPDYVADVTDIQLPSDGPTITYIERQVCGPNGCQIVRIPVQSSATAAASTVATSVSSSILPAAQSTFSGTRMQFQPCQPLRNGCRLVARLGWRLSGGAIRARRRCR